MNIQKLNEAANKIGSILLEKGITVSCAESCTGGLFAATLTSVSGISGVFEFGMTTYSNRIKSSKLGVNNNTLEKFGAVSTQTAGEMAQNIRKLADSNLGLSATGVAGPDSSEGKLPGTVYIALCDGKDTYTEKLEIIPHSRDYVRENTVLAMFKLIYKYISKGLPNE